MQGRYSPCAPSFKEAQLWIVCEAGDDEACQSDTMTKTPSFAAISRHQGKRERTRAALIDATVELIASNGPADISISDITALAGVASGTFYNHFQGKAEIIAETAFQITEQIGGQINRAGASEIDPVLRIATGSRRFVEFAVGHPSWAWALLRSISYLPTVKAPIQQHIGATIHFGVERGRFKVIEDAFTFDVMISMLFAAVRSGLSGMSASQAGSRVAEMQLRLLGVTAEAASNAAYREMEPFELAFGEPAAGKTRRRLTATLAARAG